MDHELHRSIMKTLAYFDTFDFPLTAEEIYHWLWAYPGKTNQEQVRLALAAMVENMDIAERDSFYCLFNRKYLIRIRQHTTPIVKEKMVIARRAGKIVRFIPYVRAMFVCNTVAGSVPQKKSDIDVFIIIRSGRLWMTRALITAVLTIVGMRRTEKKVDNRICLSFFVTDQHLNLADIIWGNPDIYLAYWIDQLVPIYDPDNMLQQIHKENDWVTPWLPHALRARQGHPRWMAKKPRVFRFYRQGVEACFGGFLGDSLEKMLRRLQYKKMSYNVESLQLLPDSRVIVSDSMLKFHEHDQREYFFQRWKNKCFELNI